MIFSGYINNISTYGPGKIELFNVEQIPVHKYGILTRRAADVQKPSISAFSGLLSF